MAFDDQLLIPFANRLQKVDRHRRKLARRKDVDCFRVYDFDLPEFPLVIDRYADHLYVSQYQNKGPRWLAEHSDQAWWEWCGPVISDSLEVPLDRIHRKKRRRKSAATDQYQRTDDQQQFLKVNEGGLQFWVNLTDYLDTGLFLDHRDTRSWVRDAAREQRVLNLFCYTASFSVYAADGNARCVTSVDLSRNYLEWGRDNFRLNGLLDEQRHQFRRADVTKWLEECAAQSYDLVIMDPPTFSNSKAMDGILDIQRDHVALIRGALRTLVPGGILLFSTNARRFSLDRGAIPSDQIRDITKPTTPFDFQGKMKRWCFRIDNPAR